MAVTDQDSAGAGDRQLRLTQFAVAVLAAAAVAFVAVDGGSFDLVVRQQWGVVLWWSIALGALVGALPRTKPSAAGFAVMGSFALLAAWTAISFSWTESDERTLAELSRVIAHLGVLALVVCALGPRTCKPAIAGLTAGAVLVCLYGVLSRLVPSWFDENTAVFAEDARRLSKPLGYWNAVGAWAGMTAALCLAWSAHARMYITRAVALAAVPAAAVTAYLTYSRASLGGIALGLVVLVACSKNRWTLLANAAVAGIVTAFVVLVIRAHPAIADATGNAGAASVGLALLGAAVAAGGWAALTHRLNADRLRLPLRAARIALVVGVLITVVVGAAGALLYGPDAWDDFTAPPAAQNSNDPAARLTNLNGGRYQIWVAAAKEFEAHPWTGTGAGTFEFTWNQRATRAEFVLDAHSMYLEALSELGALGLAIVLLLVVSSAAALVVALIRAPSAADRGAIAGAAGAVTAFFFGAGLDWLWESTANAVFAVALVGTAIAAVGRPLARPRLVVRLVVAAGAVLLACAQLPALVSTSEIRKSQEAVQAGDISAAREHADNAINTQPWSASALVQRALVDERAGDLDAAVIELSRAEAREPDNWRVPLIVARVEARRGDRRAALAAYARAERLRPRGQFFQAGRS